MGCRANAEDDDKCTNCLKVIKIALIILIMKISYF